MVLGIVQGLCILPGLSRSGATVSLALWLGLRPDRAFELALLIGIPVGIATLAVDAVVLDIDVVSGLFGSAFAAGFGAVGLLVLRRATLRGKLALFALWVFPVAIATLALARAWPDF